MRVGWAKKKDAEASFFIGFRRISWAAPLAKALIGSKVGDCVMWQRAGGAAEVEIISIAYEGDKA